MKSIALFSIGFSLYSVVLLAITHFREANYRDQLPSRCFGLMLVTVLAGLQSAHWAWLYFDMPWVGSAAYRILLFAVAPMFWAFSRPLLTGPTSTEPGSWVKLLHGLPLCLAPWMSPLFALPLAFIAGAGYLVALAVSLYRVREQRAQFSREFWLLGMVFLIALVVAVLGVLPSLLPGTLFFEFYAIAIGVAFLLVQIVLGLRPGLPTEVGESIRASYAVSTLNRVDRDAVLTRLNALMTNDRVYADPTLSLSTLAKQLGLNGHQLSELLNACLGKGFSRYLREQRVSAARTMLVTEVSASILSVGLSVGFNTQSNFYEAFREVEGMTPGQYRKLQTANRHEISPHTAPE